MRNVMICVLAIGLAAAGAVFSQNATLSGLAANTATDLGVIGCTQPEGETSVSCTRITDYSGMVYDPHNHRMLIFGGGHATTFTDAIEAFDLATLSWSALYPPTACSYMTENNCDQTRAAWLTGGAGPYPRPISRHTYDLLAVPHDRAEFIILAACNGGASTCPDMDWGGGGDPYFMAGRIAHYDFTDGTWSFSETAQGDGKPDYSGYTYPAGEYDPVSGKVVLLGRYGLWVYDPETRVKTREIRGDYNEYLDTLGNTTHYSLLSYDKHMTYYPPNQRMYYLFNTGEVFEVRLDRSDWGNTRITQLTVSGDLPSGGGRAFAYDTVNHIIGGAVHNGYFYAFDPSDNTWTRSTMQNGGTISAQHHALNYDPVNNVFIFQGDDRHTWAFRYHKTTTLQEHAVPAGKATVLHTFPNPFHSEAGIRVSGIGGGAALSMYNIHGRLVHRVRRASGTYIWHARGLPAGVYLIWAHLEEERILKKRVLLVR